MKKSFNWVLFAVLLFLPACGTMFGDSKQIINVMSEPPGADCTVLRLQRKENVLAPAPIAQVTAPGVVIIQRNQEPIEVSCKKAAASGSSTLKPYAAGPAMFDMLCPICIVIDDFAGTWYEYPASVVVTLR